MQSTTLTKTQQQWLTHVKSAQEQALSMAAYAKQNGLALKSFYHARKVLIKKGALQRTVDNEKLLPMKLTEQPVSQSTLACRICLPNGVAIEVASIELATVLQAASQL